MKSLYPWQMPQWRQVISQYQQNRLPHALLLCGPPGLGKSIFAGQLANLLLCKSPAAIPGQGELSLGETACGSCSGCHLLAANNHPDLYSLIPEENAKNIKVDQIRELIFALSQTGQRAGYRVAIINPADSLNKAAANALLKTLEEPEGRVLLLLVSDYPGRLPPTIRSRCQRIYFSYAQNSDHWLKQQLQQLNLNANADLLLKIAEYAPLRALYLAENNYLKIRDQLLAHLAIANVPEFLKQDLKLWMDAFISIICDVIRLHLHTPPECLINHDIASSLQKLQQSYPPASAWHLWEKLTEARRFLHSSSVNLNEQLLLESLLIMANRSI